MSTWTGPPAREPSSARRPSLARPDVAAHYGARFGLSGWELAWDTAGLTPGVHRLYLDVHRTTDNAWSLIDRHLVIVAGGNDALAADCVATAVTTCSRSAGNG